MNPDTVVNEQDGMETSASETEEQRLVSAARNGDHDAFEMLVMRSRQRLIAITRRMTGSLEEAEDLTQQTFMKAYTNISSFAGRSSFATWLTSIAMNEARMWIRKARGSRVVSIEDLSSGETFEMPRPEFTDCRPGPERLCSQAEYRRLLLAAMEQLPMGTREALKMCDIEEQSTMTTAILLGITVNALKSRRLRGRLALRRKLESTQMCRGHGNHNQAAQPSRRGRVSRTCSIPTPPEMPCP